MRALRCWVSAEDRWRNVLLWGKYTWVLGPGAPASRPGPCTLVRTRQDEGVRYTLGIDSCMFQVTIRTLRKVWCSGGADVDEGLFPSADKCAERELCGRRVCRRVNRAV